MVTLDHDELLVHLENNKIDAIAVAISHWHALGIDAFLYDLSKRYDRKVNALILIQPHITDGYVISEKDFLNDDYVDLKFHFVDTTPKDQSLISERLPSFISKYRTMSSGLRNIRSSKGQDILYLLSPQLPYTELLIYFGDKTVSSKYKPIIVLIDEGYASYVSKENWKQLRKELRKEDAKEADSTLMYSVSSNIFRSVDYIFREMILRSMPVETRFLFRLESQLKINDDICSSYKEVLKLRKNDLKMDKFGKTVLIITQPFSEMNTISLEDELSLMGSLIKVINEKGIKPVIKPHPRENSAKYNNLTDCDFDVIENNFPVEEIIPNLNPLCVIGYSSTALLNSKVFYDIDAISLSDIMRSMSKDEMLDESDEEFKTLTGNYVNFVDRVEDIEKLI
jgi:hypothetical protein